MGIRWCMLGQQKLRHAMHRVETGCETPGAVGIVRDALPIGEHVEE